MFCHLVLRQALGLSLVFLVVLAGAGIATLLQVRWELADRTEASLRADLAATIEILEEQDPEDVVRFDRDRFVVLRDEDGRNHGDLPRSVLRNIGFATREIERKTRSDYLWRILVADHDDGRIAVGRSLSTEEDVQELICGSARKTAPFRRPTGTPPRRHP